MFSDNFIKKFLTQEKKMKKNLFLLFCILFIVNSKKNEKSDYFDKPILKEPPPTIDLKRCKLYEADCLEYEFFTLDPYLEPNSSIKAKKAKFNRWLRANNLSSFYIENYYTKLETNYSQIRLFSRKEQGKIEIILNDSQYLHDESSGLAYFKDTYLINMHFQIPKPEFKAKINKLVLALLYHTAYSFDSKLEEWIYLLPTQKLSLIASLTKLEIELLKDETDAYKFLVEKRKDYIDQYYDLVGTIHDGWMRYHPQMVKDFFRRPNITMSDYIWARYNFNFS